MKPANDNAESDDGDRSQPSFTLLTVDEVASQYHLDRTTVYRRVHRPEWAAFVTRVGGIRIIREGFEAWLRLDR